jgi:hypothetical protein
MDQRIITLVSRGVMAVSPDGAAHFLVGHFVVSFLSAPHPRNLARADDLEDPSAAVLPLDDTWVVLWAQEQIAQELPQQFLVFI